MSLFALRPKQADALALLRGSIRSSLDAGTPVRTVIQAPTGFGKCLGRGTPVLMYDGSVRPVESILAGETLMGPDSRPRHALSVCSGRDLLYRVTPARGDPYVVNESHILSLKITGGVSKEKNPGRDGGNFHGKVINIGVLDYLSSSKTFKHIAKGWRAAIDFTVGDSLAISPYFLGLWLGDGFSRHASIFTGDAEVAEYVALFADSRGLRLRCESNSEGSVNLHIGGVRGAAGSNSILTDLQSYDLIRNKHVPIDYKRASVADRLDLLAGIIDTDGHLISRGGFSLTLKSEKLIDDVIFVARSLGFSAFKKRVTKTCTNNGMAGEYWVCSINGDVSSIPCLVERKKAPPRRQKKDVLVTGIKSVEMIGEGDYFGFEISGDRLFMLGDFTVTHNTVLAAHILAGTVERRQRAAFVVPMLNLIDQTHARFVANGIDAGDMGVIQGNHPMRRLHAPLQICSIQTLASRGFPEVKRVVVDECHMRFAVIDKWMDECPDVHFVGLSATPWSAGMGDHWRDLVIPTTLGELIEQGWLSPFRVFAASHPDLSKVHIIAGDYQKDELSTTMRGKKIVADVVANWVERGEGRPTLCFAVDRAHASELHDQFTGCGVSSEYVDGDTPREERELVLGRFRRGEIKVICSIGTMTTGIDEDVRCIILARPTKSEILFCQMFGRGLRTAEGKKDLLLFDHTNTTLELGLPTDIYHERLRTEETDAAERKAKKEGTAPEPKLPRECILCHTLIPATVRKCPSCGFQAQRTSTVVTEDGVLYEYGKPKPEAQKSQDEKAGDIIRAKGKQNVYSELLDMKGPRADGWVSHKYRAIFGVWPVGMAKVPQPSSPELKLYIHHLNIAYAKRKEAEKLAAEGASATDQMELANAA